MAIEVTCRCGQRFAAPAELSGRQVPCPMCGQALQIPAPQPPASVYSLEVACVCGSRFGAPASAAGQQVPCPNCSRLMTIPRSPPPVPLGGDSLWDDLPPARSLPPSTSAPGTVQGMCVAKTPRQPRPKQGHDYLPDEKNWELYYTLPIAVAIFIMGLVMIGMSLFGMRSAFASSSWSSTTATITSAELVERRVRRGVVYEARLTYAYTVDGKPYTGTRVSISGATGTSFTGEQVVEKYPMGTTHACFYDPDRPADCVLEKGTNAYTFVLPLLGLAVTVGGAVWAFRCGMTLRHRLS